MGLSIHFAGAADGDDGPFSLATASGWALFGRWVESLPAQGSTALRQLCESGEWQGTDALAGELSAALAAVPPESSDVRHTAGGLADVLGSGDPGETATVTDGAGE